MRRLIVLAAASVLIGACASPGLEVFPSPNASLGERPSVAASTTRTAAPTPSPSRPAPASPGETTAPRAPSTDVPGEGPSQQQAVAEPPSAQSSVVPGAFRPIGGINDPQGDIPRGAPAWADIIGLVLEDDGGDLRIRIDLAADLPATLRNKETARIGVDLFRGDDGETRYRVFVDGDGEGWLAYFQRPEGFVAYPGTVSVKGSMLALTVPAAAVGDPVRGDWRAFLEWSDPGGGRRQARDAAPDDGWGTFSR